MFRLVKRELRLIFEDSGASLLLLFALLIYATIYSIAYGAEVVERVPIAVVDCDKSALSRSVVEGLGKGANVVIACEVESIAEGQHLFYNRDIYGVVVISDGFERDLLAMQGASISLILDGSHLLLYRAVLEQAMADILAEREGGAVELTTEVL